MQLKLRSSSPLPHAHLGFHQLSLEEEHMCEICFRVLFFLLEEKRGKMSG